MFLKISSDFINLNAVARVRFRTLKSRFCARVEWIGERKRSTSAIFYDGDARVLQQALSNLAVNGEPDRVA